MNLAVIIGNLGADPELRQTTSGKAVTNFSVATTEYSGGNEYTEWHRVVAWERTAENCAKYLAKGSKVAVQGRIQTRKYEKDGETRYITEIVANRVQFLGDPKNGSNRSSNRRDETEQADVDWPDADDYDDDLPF